MAVIIFVIQGEEDSAASRTYQRRTTKKKAILRGHKKKDRTGEEGVSASGLNRVKNEMKD